MNIIRPSHVRILRFLETLDSGILLKMDCYFGGGTAISMLNDEYRLSFDVDFMCASNEGYAKLRELVFDEGLTPLFKEGMAPKVLRELRADQYGVRTILDLKGMPLKFEIVREARIDLTATQDLLPIATLDEISLFSEKLLANTDRGLDQSGLSKDMLDLIVMQHRWGNIPANAMRKAVKAYGTSVGRAYEKSFELLSRNHDYLNKCLHELDIKAEYRVIITDYLENHKNAHAVNLVCINPQP
ncbi:MAG: hypothetical protein CTY38_00965 [Methylotenera sp.]|uniref:nucleotidyl transferase AbiEii/AbiGii toxin family protein n=1 Tax=Methylotenera sp. TaxID=2051956 RepID=UPI000D40BC85|nr:nucleotidyl transferase AbiEii/AbiGii toxin family protein [Methylotenera sp.]PPC84649.1 MAG: hypothetical protein CTY38_00965 [Methylotenera sp.]